MKRQSLVHSEAVRIRRGYYIITAIALSGLALAFGITHFSALQRQNEAAIARLEDAVTKLTMGYLREQVERTIQSIDIERALVREELGVRPGDAEGERRADGLAKARLIPRIRETRLADDGYLWIHELLKPEGGYGYARRLVHRFLVSTEGALLSTESPQAKDAFPYREELQGIVSSGEAFTSYYFPKPRDQLPSRKISYSRLYPDFSWIVATGVYVDDIERIVNYERRVAETNRAGRVSSGSLSLALLIGGMVALVVLIDRATNRAIKDSYGRILAAEQALKDEKRKVEEAYELMKELAERDALTGLRNRRSGLARLDIEASRSARVGCPFCVALCDIDRFKAFNDRYGHETGDRVLKAVAKALEEGVRLEDMALRWGGEEFLMLLSGDALPKALEAAERLRRSVAERSVAAGDELLSVSITIGVAEYSPGEPVDRLIARADAAMYKGKAAGRNVVVAAPPPGGS